MMAVSGQKDFMRGLHNFISAVHRSSSPLYFYFYFYFFIYFKKLSTRTHTAKTKEDELKVVNREMAKIRNYYKEEKVCLVFF